MAGSFTFRNLTTYVVEPVGEPIESLPTKSSLDFSPQNSDDGGLKRYASYSNFPGTGDVNFLYLAIDTNYLYSWDGSIYVKVNINEKEDITGLKITDSPEFANTQITTLTTDGSGGVIPATEWTWLGATANSVLSVLTKIIAYIYSIKDAVLFATPRLNQTITTGEIALDRCITQYNNYQMAGALALSVASGSIVEATAEGVILGDGTNSPTLSGITLWATSAAYVNTAAKQNHFMIWKTGDGVYIAWTQKN